MKLIYLSLLVWVCVFTQSQTSFAQITPHRFDQLDSLQNIEKRKIVVFIHTDWCKYCQTMQNTTFKNDSIIKILNSHFYFLDLNAEERRNINFQSHTFKYKPTGSNTGIHELAEQLATIDGKVTYPTICILNSNKEIIFQYNQFINETNLQSILAKLK